MIELSRCCLVVSACFISGCSTFSVPKYEPSIVNAGALLADRTVQVRVGAFSVVEQDADKPNQFTIDDSSSSPRGESYVEFLRDAVRQEMRIAGILSENADVEISGVLLKNEIDTSGANSGFADLAARFTVRKQGVARYEKIKSARREWRSPLGGLVPVVMAHRNYSAVVQQLLNSLYNDPEFQQVLKDVEGPAPAAADFDLASKSK